MREILFRGFHPCENGDTVIVVDGKEYTGRWIEGFPYQCTKVGWTNPVQNETYIQQSLTLKNGEIILTGIFEVIPETVGQFTGLLDKDGKRIFEHDVVIDDRKWHGVVEWQDGSARFMVISHRNGERYIGYVDKEPCRKVIGTIFEKEAAHE